MAELFQNIWKTAKKTAVGLGLIGLLGCNPAPKNTEYLPTKTPEITTQTEDIFQEPESPKINLRYYYYPRSNVADSGNITSLLNTGNRFPGLILSKTILPLLEEKIYNNPATDAYRLRLFSYVLTTGLLPFYHTLFSISGHEGGHLRLGSAIGIGEHLHNKKTGKTKDFDPLNVLITSFKMNFLGEHSDWVATGERIQKIKLDPRYAYRKDLKPAFETASFNQIEQARKALVNDIHLGEAHVFDYPIWFSYAIEPMLYPNSNNSDFKDYIYYLEKEQGIRLSRADIQYRNTLLRFLGIPNILYGLHQYFKTGDVTSEPITFDIGPIKMHLPEGETYFTPQGHLMNLKQRFSAGSQDYNAHLELGAGINLPNDRPLSEISVKGELRSPSLSITLEGLYRDGPEHGNWFAGEIETKPFMIANELGCDLPRILKQVEAGIRVQSGKGTTSARYNRGHNILESKETDVGMFIGLNTRF